MSHCVAEGKICLSLQKHNQRNNTKPSDPPKKPVEIVFLFILTDPSLRTVFGQLPVSPTVYTNNYCSLQHKKELRTAMCE